MQTNRYGKRFAVLWVLLGFCLALGGCDKQSAASASAQPASAPPAEVGVVTLSPQSVAITSELAGRTSAHLVAEVRPQVGGIIQKRLFTEGGDVKAGEVLYQIDPASYKAAYDAALAALHKAKAVLATAQSKAKRYKELVGLKAVSQQDYEDAVGAVQQAEADVEAREADLDTARINLDYTKVASPISGRVGKSSVTTGALVTASQSDALCKVQQLDPIYVDVTQSTVELLRLKQNLDSGQLKSNGVKEAKVKLIIEDGVEYPMEGTLKFSDVTVDQSTGSVTVRALFPNPDHLLLPGMYVRAIVQQGVNDKAILAPQQGVARDSRGNATALVVGQNDVVEQRMLKVSKAMGDKWLVTEGLNPGDRLIVEGLQKVHPGSSVKTVPLDAAPTAASGPVGALASTEAPIKK